MKTLIYTFALALMLASTATVQATSLQDTVKVIENPQRVIITEDSTGSHIKVLSATNCGKPFNYNYTVAHNSDDKVKVNQHSDWELKLPFLKSDSSRASRAYWSVILDGIYLGFGWPQVGSGHEAFKQAMGHEYEMGIMNLVGVQFSTGYGQDISLGVGIEARRYHMHTVGLQFAKNEAGKVDIMPFPDGAHKRKANIELSSLQFPLVFKQYVGDFHFSVAAIMNVNTTARLHAQYRLDDKDFDVCTRRIGHRPVTFDVMGAVSYESLGWYVRYRPQSVLKPDFGPKISTITTGFILAF